MSAISAVLTVVGGRVVYDGKESPESGITKDSKTI